MLGALLNWQFWLESHREQVPAKERSLLSKLVYNGLILVDSYAIFLYLKLRGLLGLASVRALEDDGNGPIVSLTSFPARFRNLWMVLYCLFRQSLRPSRIVLTLINGEVPGGFDSLPKSLKRFSDKGVEFIFRDENLLPHNKYFYTMQLYPDRDIITVDDDLIYNLHTIELLVRLHEEYPKAVCANRVRRVLLSAGAAPGSGSSTSVPGAHSSPPASVVEAGSLFATSETDVAGRASGIPVAPAPYESWPVPFVKCAPSHDLVAMGYAGVYYPATFRSAELLNAGRIKSLCLRADDLWLKVQEILADVKVAVGDYYAHPVILPSSQKITLASTNRGTFSRNDTYLRTMIDFYGQDIFQGIR